MVAYVNSSQHVPSQAAADGLGRGGTDLDLFGREQSHRGGTAISRSGLAASFIADFASTSIGAILRHAGFGGILSYLPMQVI